MDTAPMGYRASFQSSVQHSYFMLYQKEIPLPIDVEMIEETDGNSSEDL